MVERGSREHLLLKMVFIVDQNSQNRRLRLVFNGPYICSSI